MLQKDKKCDYHHAAAEWCCTECQRGFCGGCVPHARSGLWGRSGVTCTLCNQPLTFLGSAQKRPAFWTQLSHFFQYPLQTNSLIVIALLSVASFILPGFGLIGVIFGVVLLAVSFKYGFAILEARAANDRESPSWEALMESDEHYLFLQFLVVVAVIGGLLSVLGGANESLGFLLMWVMTLAMPAITILLAIEKSVFAALNPAKLFAFVSRIGWPYILVWLCFQIVSSGPDFILPVLYNVIPSFLVFPFLVLLMLYFWCVSCCMLGYTVYQYQEELGYESSDDEGVLVDEARFDKDKVLAEAYILSRENNVQAAQKRLRPMLDRYKDDSALHEFYHRLLVLLGEKAAIVAHADYILPVLLARREEPLAISIFQETLTRAPDYKVKDVEGAFQMAKTLELRGQKREAMQLLTNLHKIDPQSPVVAPAYLMLAKLFSEFKNDDNQALKILSFVLKKYPNSTAKPEVLKFQAILAGLQEASAG